MILTEWLIFKARQYWDHGQQIPVDLFYELVAQGLDADRLEKVYMNDKEQ